MASERSDNTDGPEQAHEPRECMACRGTGRVISRLGGETSTVACPWCEGGGVRIPGIDAQARWGEAAEGQRGQSAAGAQAPAEQAPAGEGAAAADAGA